MNRWRSSDNVLSVSVLVNNAPIAPLLIEDFWAAPTPYHAVERSASLFLEAGFAEVRIVDEFPEEPGRYYVAVGGALVAWVQGADFGTSPGYGFNIVGAHTDSPNIRVRANADIESGGWSQVGVETYGGLLLNSWLDRDLGLAGRVVVRATQGGTAQGGTGQTTAELLVRDDNPVLRIPQLAIHLDRDIRDKGLKLNPQTQMTPVWAMDSSDGPKFRRYISSLLEVEPEEVLSWDLMAFDTQKPAIVGRDSDLIASARIDNLLSVFCGVRALVAAAEVSTASVPVLALYDHEEVGSESATGASGAFLGAILERISAAGGSSRPEFLRQIASSFVVSADGAHATHPNYVDKHEPSHQIAMNGGVVIKRNANQRYATDAISESAVRTVCGDLDIPVQTYIHRNDLPCGSTIGPLTAAQLSIPTVDLGAPQLAMHSIRELCGVADADHLASAMLGIWAR